ncbi:MAG TPA: hypothetical protein VMS64_08685 [Candidatus Methylomirabilis sp.]|nr:hypothetical protein [Candidatus Methylomirabilis sp.]
MKRLARQYLVGATALLGVLLASMPSSAHQAASAPAVLSATVTSSPAVDDNTVTLGLLLLAFAALIVVGFRWPRRLVAPLAILLLVLAFQAGLHAAHHMGGADQCVVALATAHLVASPAEVVTVDLVAAPRFHAAPSAPLVQVTLHRPVPHEGRGPPHSTV